MSIPSLRQKQIDEVLDYHKLMNQVVFNRNVRNVAALNEKATPPHRTDLEVEAEFRSKVDAIKQSLSELVNMYGYLGLGTVTPPPGGPGGPGGPPPPGGPPGASAPPIPGSVAATTVAASSTKAQTKIESIISTILSNYNSLVQFYENKQRQKVFSENEIQSLIGIVKELDSPIVNVIGQLMVFKGQAFYLKSYNILKNILNAVRAAPPLQKIPFELLNKEYFVPEERGTDLRHIDPTLVEHLAAASADIESNIDRYTKLVPSNRTEEKGRQLVLEKLYQSQTKIDSLIESHRRSGKPLSDTIVKKYDADLAKIKGLSNKYLPGVPLSLRTITVDFGPSTGAPVRTLPDVLETGTTRTVGERPTTVEIDGELYAFDSETGEYVYIDPEESEGKEREGKSDSEGEENESDTMIRDGKLYRLYTGEGKPKKGGSTRSRNGGSLRSTSKNGGNRFGDETVLEPYLTKHLRPSKFHSKIPKEQQESSSSESESDLEPDHVTSSSESEGESGSSSSSSDEEEGAGRRHRKHKNIVNPNLILKQGKDGLSLVDKVLAKPRGGRKKAVKPLLNNNRDKDYWFLG